MLVIAYIPCGSEEEADRISTKLVKKKLAACGNIIKADSVFRWEGKLKKEGEWILLAKTLPERFEKLKKEVEKLHSYDLPCIIGIPVVDGNEDYINWVREQVE